MKEYFIIKFGVIDNYMYYTNYAIAYSLFRKKKFMLDEIS